MSSEYGQHSRGEMMANLERDRRRRRIRRMFYHLIDDRIILMWILCFAVAGAGVALMLCWATWSR